MLIVLVMAAPLTALGAQPDPEVLVNIDSLQNIPAPELIAASLTLLSQSYDDVRLGSVMLGMAQLLGVWSEELKAAFDRELTSASMPAGVGLSTGVAAVSREAESLAEAIRAADTRMYRNKNHPTAQGSRATAPGAASGYKI